MNKKQYDALFDKAKAYYNKNDNKVTQETPNYPVFKSACIQLIDSKYNDISIDDNQKWNKLNRLFEPANVEELLKADW